MWSLKVMVMRENSSERKWWMGHWYHRARDEEDKVKQEVEARAKAVERRFDLVKRVINNNGNGHA